MHRTPGFDIRFPKLSLKFSNSNIDEVTDSVPAVNSNVIEVKCAIGKLYSVHFAIKGP